ncbi:AAA family ATPase [Geovibrio thiophilus]|uniref:AAA family ATPase n=1 Tax=Geovibrio thiophilus TaxID=139438 RepID=A0A3R6AZ60_9BACT|nr:sigma 54-interacting transcriptional regulator [Geovibrio thiophilus]QAR33892.1 AAA family ATPase [Geovibrio thiophilus]
MDILNMRINDLLKVDPDSKVIYFMNQRVLIDDSISKGLLRKELIQIFGKYGAKNVLTRYGYAHGWRTAEILKNKFPKLLNSASGGAHLHILFGLFITTMIEQTDGSGDEPLIHSIIKSSHEAEQHLLHFGRSDEPVCWTLTGFASGYESFKHGRDVYFIETKCVGKGDAYCEIEGRFADKWGDALKEQLPFYGMDSINDIMNELTDRICSTEKKLKKTQMHLQNLELKKHAVEGMVIRSKKMQDIVNLAERTAKVCSPVLIVGDSGAGKEVLARYIHNSSSCAACPFIAVNCGAFTDSLLESELFGHAKGAFTGADREHKGLFEEAEGGTLFLDEIGETSPSMQVKLLRVLQEKEIRRLGENKPRKINVRIISATNRCLETEIKNGSFRKDLYYRLRVIELNIPPLRARTEDILPLAHFFLKQASAEMKTDVTGFSPAAAEVLLNYDWPGNVRELQNAVQRAAALCESRLIGASDLPPEINAADAGGYENSSFRTLEDMERAAVEKTLVHVKGNRKLAADRLGIGVATLYRKLKQYGLQ